MREKVVCPWHVEKTPSCLVDHGTGKVYCFGCGKRATVDEYRIASASKG